MIDTNRGLLVLPFWARLILTGQKTWEIRSTNTKQRGTIGIIPSGSGKVLGEVKLIDSFPLTRELFERNIDKHRIMCDYEQLPDNYKCVWVMQSPFIYPTPIPYEHKQGAIIWVKLDF